MDARRTTSICASPEFQLPLRPTRVPSRPSRQSALINYAHRLRIARNRHRLRHYYGRPRLYPAGLAADVERLHTLARNGDATAARRASSEALVWHGHLAPPVAAGAPSIRRLAPGARWRYTIGGCSGKERAPWMMSRSRQLAQVVTPDSWVRDPLHAYTPAARHEIACAGALSINDMQSLGARSMEMTLHKALTWAMPTKKKTLTTLRFSDIYGKSRPHAPTHRLLLRVYRRCCRKT